MKIEYDKDFEKVMSELQSNFGWINIYVLPDSYKDLLNDTIKAVKNCSISATVGQSELFFCPLPDARCDRHKIDDEEGRWEFCNTCKREWARELPLTIELTK